MVASLGVVDVLPSWELLKDLADAHHQEFSAAEPFPHVVIDGLLESEALDRVAKEFPEPGDVPWQVYDAPAEVKLALAEEDSMGPQTRFVLHELNGQRFVRFLERLTGLCGLVPDPMLWGGGLHQIRRGGLLKIHADFQIHPELQLQRRLNVLVYLNHEWSTEFGGALEIWSGSMDRRVRSIQPDFGRMVVFETGPKSFHGHPEPLACPEERSRRSIALYYYSLPAPGAPELAKLGADTTAFRARPGERFSRSARQRLKPWLPPALVTASRRLGGK